MSVLVRAPLEGEILAPADTITVICRPNAVLDRRDVLAFPAGISIAEIVNGALASDLRGKSVRVWIEDHQIPAESWHRIRLRPGRTLTVLGVPQGGNVWRSIASIFVSVAALILAPLLAAPIISAFQLGALGAGLVTGLIGAGITIAGSLAINALFPVAKPSISQLSGDNATRSPTYSIGGSRNQGRPYEVVPVLLGRHRVSPFYGAQPYTEIVGDDQYLRMLFVWGYGPINVTDLKIGETPIGQFEGVEIQTIPMHTDGVISLYPSTVIEEQLQVDLNPPLVFTARTTAERAREIVIDLVWPGGVYRIEKTTGNRVAYTSSVYAEFRVLPSGGWNALGSVALSTVTVSTVRRQLRVVVGEGQYEVRVRKNEANYVGEDVVQEAVTWTALRTIRYERPIRSPVPITVTALRIKASSELSGVIDTFNGVATALVRGWNGSAWIADQPSSNPADLFRHVLQGAGNARPRTDAQIDLPSIQAWHAYCVANGFRFNQVRDFAASVPETLRDIAAAGRAALAMIDGKWGVIFDQPAAPIVQTITPRNSSGFEGARGFVELPHAFRVRFINEEQGWRQDERIVYADGYTAANATQFEGIDFAGVTSPALIWRHARFHMAQLALRRETFTVLMDFEHLVATRGDRVRVNHDVPKWGLAAGRVTATVANPDQVAIDERITLDPTAQNVVRFRLADGATLMRNVVYAPGETSALTLQGTGALPARGDLCMVGVVGFESQVLRVLSIEPQSDFTARITLVNDAPEISQADAGIIPAFQTGLAPTADTRNAVPRNVLAIERPVDVGGQVRPALRVSWDAPSFGSPILYEVQYRRVSDIDWQAGGTTVAASRTLIVLDLDSGTYDIRVRSQFGLGASSNWTTIRVAVAIGQAAPGDVIDFAISGAGETALLSWSPVQNPFVSHYEIRFSTQITGANWTNAVVLVPRATGTQVAAPANVGTYLIKAITFTGVQSTNAALVVSSAGSLQTRNEVETVVEQPAFSGVRTNVAVDGGGGLILASGEDVFSWPDVFAVPDVFFGFNGLPQQGIYRFANRIDLGEVMPCRVSALIDAVGVNFGSDIFATPDVFALADVFGVSPGDWSALVQMRTTNTNPAGSPVWTAWAPLIAGTVSARAFEFRAILSSAAPTVTPRVTALSATVDMPDRVASGDDVSVPAAGLTITFTPRFRVLRALVIRLQGALTGDTFTVTAKTVAGFTIQCFNAAGTPVARSIDWIATGYGTIQ